MSERKKSLFKYNVILLPWIIMICIVFSLQIQCENVKQEVPEEYLLSQEDVLKLEIDFRKALEEYFSCIKTNFKDDNFDAIAEKMDEYKEKINFYDLQGKKLKEKEKIKEFWKNAKKVHKVTEVNFSILNLRVLLVAEPVELPDPQDTIIATGHAVFIYQLIKDTGKEVSNSIGTGTYDAPHPRRCIW